MNNEAYKKHVGIGIPVLLLGGTERQTLALASVLLSGGYKVTVWCYYESDASMISELTKIGAEVLLLGLNRAEGLLSLLDKLKNLWKGMKPDIIHVQYIAPGLIPVIAAKLAGIKTIFATVHQPGRVYGWKEKLFLRTAARLCTAFFCNSKSVEESWFGDSEIFDPNRDYKKRKHFTIYNGVDIEHIEQVVNSTDRQSLKGSLGISDRPVIGVVGRLRWEKGQDILIEAMPEVVRAIPSAMLLVVGDGPDRMSLEQRAKSLELENNILWLGQKSPEEVYQLCSIMDVVVVPSRFEGFGLTAAEAMSASRPVIGSRLDGLTEVVANDVTGLLVSSGDSAALGRALIDLLSDKGKAKEMGEKGRMRVGEFFSVERFQNSVLAAYKALDT
ncbi:MAG: glycosyltransferase family 4 protein [Ignavibacterium sp.]|nr:glycosyltransferase family 4 protein [Ignavibacterium sp.]